MDVGPEDFRNDESNAAAGLSSGGGARVSTPERFLDLPMPAAASGLLNEAVFFNDPLAAAAIPSVLNLSPREGAAAAFLGRGDAELPPPAPAPTPPELGFGFGFGDGFGFGFGGGAFFEGVEEEEEVGFAFGFGFGFGFGLGDGLGGPFFFVDVGVDVDVDVDGVVLCRMGVDGDIGAEAGIGLPSFAAFF